MEGPHVVRAVGFSWPAPGGRGNKGSNSWCEQWKSPLDPGGPQTVLDNQSQLGVGSWESEITQRPEVKCGDL